MSTESKHTHNGIRINSKDTNIKKIKSWIDCFVHELNVYNTINKDDEIWRRYAERPMVSLMATGITRNDSRNSISILQEYGVYDKGKFLGRADLFIAYKGTAYIMECKFAEGKGGKRHWKRDWEQEYFSKIFDQGNKYHLAEMKEYEYYSNLYVGIIIFQQISHTNCEKFAEHAEKSKIHLPAFPDSFYTFITYEPLMPKGNWYSGLEVYGAFRKKK